MNADDLCGPRRGDHYAENLGQNALWGFFALQFCDTQPAGQCWPHDPDHERDKHDNEYQIQG